MTSIRITIAVALAVGALLAGGTSAQHAAPAGVRIAAVAHPDGPVTCCDE